MVFEHAFRNVLVTEFHTTVDILLQWVVGLLSEVECSKSAEVVLSSALQEIDRVFVEWLAV